MALHGRPLEFVERTRLRKDPIGNRKLADIMKKSPQLDVPALGSVYLGGFTFAELARAGRVEELRPGALVRADELFRGDRAPWCVEIF